ncbi:MAG: TIGR03087 family PEP-CTERM/XrtA system glycosyltransferase [Thermodesulfobacteriota bacterium]
MCVSLPVSPPLAAEKRGKGHSPHLLYLAHRIPYPPNKGDKIRSFHQIQHLARAGYAVHLVCLADRKNDLEYRTVLRQWCRSVHVVYRSSRTARLRALPWLATPVPLSVPCFYSRKIQSIVDRLLQTEPISGVVCFSSVMGEYILRGCSADSRQQLLVMDFCDVDSDKWRQYSRASRAPMAWIYTREAALLGRYERIVNAVADASLFVSPAEAELFQKQAPRPERVQVVANGVDHEFFAPWDQPPTQSVFSPVLLFTGAMDYAANVDGVTWFCRTSWPDVHHLFPSASLYIVGANPVAEVQNLAADRVVVTGYVHDVREYYARADICVIPLRMARGVQNKVLEALAMGKPVVANSTVLQGIAAQPERDLLIADTPEAFTEQIARLVRDPALGQRLGRSGREFVLREHNWASNLAVLEGLLQWRPNRRQSSAPARGGRLSPLFFLLAVVVTLGGSLWPMPASPSETGGLLILSPKWQNFLHLPVFMFFGLFFADFLQYFRGSSRWRLAVFLIAGIAYACAVEGIQLGVPGRFCSAADMLVNMVGVLLGGGIFYKLRQWRVRKGAKSHCRRTLCSGQNEGTGLGPAQAEKG